MSKTDYLRATDRVRPGSGGGSVTLSGGGGGDAQTLGGYKALDFLSPAYLTLSNDANLRNERVLTPGSGLQGTDAGANAAYTLAVRLKGASGLEADAAGLALADSVAGAGLGISAKVMAVNVGTGVRIVSDAVAIGVHSHETGDLGGQIDHGAALLGLADDDHSQYLHLAPALTVRNTIQATASDVVPLTLKRKSGQTARLWQVTDEADVVKVLVSAEGDLQSGNYVNGIIDGFGWQLSQTGRLECSSAFIRGTLYAATFTYKEINALNGYFYVTNASPLKRALTASTGDDVIYVEGPVFATGSWLVMQTLASLAGGYIVKREWMKVIADAVNGTWDSTYRAYKYKVTRNVYIGDGGVLSAWGEGNAVVELGRTAAGGWVTMVGGSTDAEGPYVGVTRRTADTATGFSQIVRLGNLRGVLGIGSDTSGLALGDLSAGSKRYLRADADNFVLHGMKQLWYDSGGNQRGEVNPDASGAGILFWLGPSSADRRLSMTADGAVTVKGSITVLAGSSGIANYSDAGAVVTADDLDGIGDGSTYKRTTTNERTGAGRAYNDINASGNFIGAVDPGHTAPTAAGAGLYLGSDYLGYWNGTAWRVYVRDNGYFYFSPDGTRYVAYTGGDLLVTGVNLTITDGKFSLKTAASGSRIEITSTEIAGYASATKQFYIRASDGRAMFGGGKGVLDSSGIVLSGNETSYNTYNALRWQTAVDPPGGTAVARVAAGLFTPIETYGNYPTLQLYANPGLQTYGKLEALAYQSSTSYYEQLLLHNGYGHATALLRVVDNGAVKAGITLVKGSMDQGTVLLHTNNVERLRLIDNGNLGLGVSPSYHLHVYGSGVQQAHVQSTDNQAGYSIQNGATTANIYLPSGSSELSFFSGSSRQVWFTTGGNAYKRDNTTTWSTTSDGALKRDVEALRGALGTIRQLRPVTYRWAKSYRPSDKATHVGFLAQEWAEVFPEYVGVDEEGHMTMNLGPLHEYLVVAIQEMDARLSALEARGRAA